MGYPLVDHRQVGQSEALRIGLRMANGGSELSIEQSDTLMELGNRRDTLTACNVAYHAAQNTEIYTRKTRQIASSKNKDELN